MFSSHQNKIITTAPKKAEKAQKGKIRTNLLQKTQNTKSFPRKWLNGKETLKPPATQQKKKSIFL